MQARNLAPLRIVVSGPPMAGKSVLAARLGQLYGLPVFCAKELVAAVAAGAGAAAPPAGAGTEGVAVSPELLKVGPLRT